MRPPRRPGRRLRVAQHGLSLVELMVGIAIGLFVVAAATLVVTTQLGNNRRLLLETQLQQDLRATMDIVTRELRRAGSASDAAALRGVWYSPDIPVLKSDVAEARAVSAEEVEYRYVRGTDPGPFGFKLESGLIKSRLGGAGWQELTDGNVMQVTRFLVTPTVTEAPIACPRLCEDGSTDCWPTLAVRRFAVEIDAVARHDAEVRRSLRSEVRLRNDEVRFRDFANPDRVCPE